MGTSALIILVFVVIGLAVGSVAGYIFRQNTYEKKITEAKLTAEDILAKANQEAKTAKKEALLEARIGLTSKMS